MGVSQRGCEELMLSGELVLIGELVGVRSWWELACGGEELVGVKS